MRRALVILCALVVALTAGCGGDDHEEHEPDATADQSTSATSDSDTTAAPQGGEAGGEAGGHAHDTADFPAAEATDIAKISMRDYAYVDMPATVTGPRLRIEAKNNGPSAHEIMVFDADGNGVGGIEAVAPGESAVVSLELPAGTYEMRCLIPISDTETHLDRGMRAVFAVM